MMNTNKTFPILLAAALTIGSGTLIAIAQDSDTANAPVEMQNDGERAERGERGKRHGKDRHGRHHGHHGHKGHHGRRGMGRGMMMDVFGQIDTDGDGRVTRADIDTFRTEQIANADTGGDGALSIEEFETLYRAFTRTPMVRAFQRLDRDGDGVVTTEEMDRPMERMIRRMDRDGDGVLTLERGRGKRG